LEIKDFVTIPDAAALVIKCQLALEAWFKPFSSSPANKNLLTSDITKVTVTLSKFPELLSEIDMD
jgi:hypothetical protein